MEVQRYLLQLWVWGAARDELALLPSPRGEGGDNAAQDEDTPEVIHHNLVPASAKEVGEGGDHKVDSAQLAQRGAGFEQVLWQGSHELGPAPCPVRDVPPAQARRGQSNEGGYERGRCHRGRFHERDRANDGVTGVALGRVIEGNAQRRFQDGAVRDPAQVSLPPTELGDARGREENLQAPAGPAGPLVGVAREAIISSMARVRTPAAGTVATQVETISVGARSLNM